MGKPRIHPNVWAAYVTAAATIVTASFALIPKMGCKPASTEMPAIVDLKDPNNWTPLYRAARDNNESGVVRLLAQGADPNTPDNHGWTPLFQAARRGNAQMIRDLMGKGAAIDVQSDLKETPLHLAASSGDVETIKAVALDKSGNPMVNVNAEDVHGQRPLHYAAKAGNPDAVKELLDIGAEDSKDDEGRLAQDVAKNGKCRDLIKDALPKRGRGNPLRLRL
jgi:ankyrin repeat protein